MPTPVESEVVKELRLLRERLAASEARERSRGTEDVRNNKALKYGAVLIVLILALWLFFVNFADYRDRMTGGPTRRFLQDLDMKRVR